MNEKLKEQIEHRYEYNMLILDKLKTFFDKNPDIRFHQGLQALKINVCETPGFGNQAVRDDFYVESKTTYESINEEI